MGEKSFLFHFYSKLILKYIKYWKRKHYGEECEKRCVDLGKHLTDILKIFNDNKINIFRMKTYEDRLKCCTILLKNCITTLLDRLSPNTIILKIQKFKDFLNVSKDMKSIKPLLNMRIMTDFIKEDLSLVVRRLRRSDKALRLKKIKKDPEQAIYHQDVDKVLNSSYYSRGWSLLIGGKKNDAPSLDTDASSNADDKDSFYDGDELLYSMSKLRDILIFQIVVTTSVRSGLIGNLTMKEYSEIEKISTDCGGGGGGGGSPLDLYVLRCNKHKTSWKYGEAVIFLTPIAKKGLDAYVKYVRPRLRQSDDDDDDGGGCGGEGEKAKLFLTSEGNYFSPQSVYNSMLRLTRLCGLNKKFTTTRNRKGTTAETVKYQPHLREDVCDMLCHGVSTSDKYYNTHSKIEDLHRAFAQTKKGQSLIDFSKSFCIANNK